MKESSLIRYKREVFKQCGLKTSDKRYNIHHDIEKFDVKRGLVAPDFPVNNRHNLTPLPVDIHRELHEMMDNDPFFARDVTTRIYMANMAFINELDLVPDRFYRTRVP